MSRNSDSKRTAHAKPFELDPLDKAILKAKLEYPGISNVALAEELQVDSATIAKRMKREIWQSAFDYQMMPSKERINSMTDKAAKVFDYFLSTKDPDLQNIRYKVARDILITSGDIQNKFSLEKSTDGAVIIELSTGALALPYGNTERVMREITKGGNDGSDQEKKEEEQEKENSSQTQEKCAKEVS